MASWIQNQPVFFGTPPQCSSDEISVPQLVDINDTCTVQFQLQVCDEQLEENVIPDPDFSDPKDYELGANWGISYNVLCLSGGSPAGTSVYTASGGLPLSIFTAGYYYQVNIVVDSISVGGQLDVYMGLDLIGTITTSGTHTFYGLAANPTTDGYVLTITSPLDNTNVCLSSITAFQVLTNFVVAVYEEDGTFATSFEYDSGAQYFVLSEDTITIQIDWPNLTYAHTATPLAPGCYYLCILDPCVNTSGQNYPADIRNQNLNAGGGGTTSWNLSPFCWVSQPTDVKGTTSGINDDMAQSDVFPLIGSTYTISIQITGGTSIGLDVYFGINPVATLTTIGTHVVTGQCLGSKTLTLTLASGANVIVTNVSPVTPDGETIPFTCDFTSNMFKYGDYSDSCTLLLKACNNESGLGFNFNASGFNPTIRLLAKLKQAKYPEERITQEDSQGSKKTIYFNGRKAKQLAIDLQEEYVHDFLRLLGGFDNFFIDGVRYFVEDDEYEVEYGDMDNIGKSKILISTRQQNIKNKNCSDTESDCTFDFSSKG